MDNWTWEWVGEGTEDADTSRGRTYYDSVLTRRESDGFSRIYNVGDAVLITSNGDDVWIAQVVEFFTTRPDDTALRDILRADMRRRVAQGRDRYELMRCTLRWFYFQEDVPPSVLRRSGMPRPYRTEYYFSDHVESSGYHDVQVIEGRAWLFGSREAEQTFRISPDRRFHAATDKLRIVRGFFNCGSSVRELLPTELDWLLNNPTLHADLYVRSRVRFMNATGAVLKGTGGSARKRASTLRAPVDVEEDEYDPESDEGSEKDEPKFEEPIQSERDEGAKEHARRRRRKVVDNDEEDDSMRESTSDLDGLLFATDRPESPDTQRQSLDLANEEVLNLIHELHGGMDMEMPMVSPDNLEDTMDVDMVVPASALDFESPQKRNSDSNSGRKSTVEQKSPAKVSEIIDLDGDDSDAPVDILSKNRKAREAKREAARRAELKNQREKLKLRLGQSAARKTIGTKTRPSFMPTARVKKPASPAPMLSKPTSPGIARSPLKTSPGRREQAHPPQLKSPDSQMQIASNLPRSTSEGSPIQVAIPYSQAIRASVPRPTTPESPTVQPKDPHSKVLQAGAPQSKALERPVGSETIAQPKAPQESAPREEERENPVTSANAVQPKRPQATTPEPQAPQPQAPKRPADAATVGHPKATLTTVPKPKPREIVKVPVEISQQKKPQASVPRTKPVGVSVPSTNAAPPKIPQATVSRPKKPECASLQGNVSQFKAPEVRREELIKAQTKTPESQRKELSVDPRKDVHIEAPMLSEDSEEDIDAPEQAYAEDEREKAHSPPAKPRASLSELNRMMLKLREQFQNMSPSVQRLFSSKIDWAFDNVIAKVTRVGIHRLSEQQMAAVVREIMNDLQLEMERQSQPGVKAGASETVGGDSEMTDL